MGVMARRKEGLGIYLKLSFSPRYRHQGEKLHPGSNDFKPYLPLIFADKPNCNPLPKMPLILGARD